MQATSLASYSVQLTHTQMHLEDETEAPVLSNKDISDTDRFQSDKLIGQVM